MWLELLDGPAKGEYRIKSPTAPRVLRATTSPEGNDILDAFEDKARPEEVVHGYRVVRGERRLYRDGDRSKTGAWGIYEYIQPIELVVYTDGGNIGNPGPAACAAVACWKTDGLGTEVQGELVVEASEEIGVATNNEAEYCNTPDAPVLMGDFTFKPIGEVSMGDLVVGWDFPDRPARSRRRQLVRSTVIATARREAETVRLHMESGDVVTCTPDHKWGVPESRNPRSLLVYRPAEEGRPIYRLFNEPKGELLTSESIRDAAWLGGMYDGEGSRRVIAQSQSANPYPHQQIGVALSRLGFEFSSNKNGYNINGGRDEFLRFLAWCQPAKMRSPAYWIDRHIHTSRMRPDRVLKIESAGVQEVVSLQTTSGNYTAWGLASKNCGLMLGVRLAKIAGATHVDFVTDSELMARQLVQFAVMAVGNSKSTYAVRDPKLVALHNRAVQMLDDFIEWKITAVRREQNRRADWLVNQLLRPESKKGRAKEPAPGE